MLTCVFGRRGSGKTTLIRALVPKLKKPIVILDLLSNYQGYESSGAPWYDTNSISDALGEIKSWLENPKEHSGVIVIQTGEINRALDFLCSALWKIGGGTLVLDEIDAFSIPESPCFDEAIRYGRNRGIDLVTGCRRPAEISKNITAGCDLVYCLVTHEPRDIDYYRDFLGDDLAIRLPKLAPFHGIYYDFQTFESGEFKTLENGTIVRIKSQARTPSQAPTPMLQDVEDDPDSESTEPEPESYNAPQN